MTCSTLMYSPAACNDLRTAQGGYPDFAALPAGLTSKNRLVPQVDAADRAFLRHGMHSDGAHLGGDGDDHPLLLAFKKENPGVPGEHIRRDFLALLRRDLYDVATVMDRLSGGATLILQTGDTPKKLINIAENNFAKVYFTPQWMDRLSPKVHEPLSKTVGTFINDIQVPIVAYQRARLGIDNATQNVQGYAHIPRSLVPINMVVSGHPSSPWRGRSLGTTAASASAPLAPQPTTSLSLSSRSNHGDVVEIPDSDDEDDGAMLSTPSRPSRSVAKPTTKVSLYADTSDEETDVEGPGLLAVRAAASAPISSAAAPSQASRSAAATQAELKKYASPHPYISDTTRMASPTPLPSAMGRGATIVSSRSRTLSISTISTTPLISTSPPPTFGASQSFRSSRPGTPYTRFNPIIPPGPSSERWLSDNKWPPRFANVLREVAEETSLGSWADVLVKKHNVDCESAKAMVKCLLEDSAYQYQQLPTV